MSEHPFGTVLKCMTEGYTDARVMVISRTRPDIFPDHISYKVVVVSPYTGYPDIPDGWGRVGEVKILMVEGGTSEYRVVE